MSPAIRLRRLARDTRGGMMIEFALLAPMLIAMLMGIIVMGIQMQSYNALRSASADLARYTMIEFQKGNRIENRDVEQMGYAIAGESPYNLSVDRLNIQAIESGSSISQVRKFTITLSYIPPNIIDMFGLSPPMITRTQVVRVPDLD